MKVFSAQQIKAWDQYTIKNEPIASVNLMERASEVFTRLFLQRFSPVKCVIMCGHGNNGGDGLAIARMLHEKGVSAEVWLFQYRTLSPDAQVNYSRLLNTGVPITVIGPRGIDESEWLRLNTEDVILIDALFGTGLTRMLEGVYAECIHRINALQKEIVSVDLPSGLFSDQPCLDKQPVIKACHTITFQVPKRSFFYRKHHGYIGDWEVADIGLSKRYEHETLASVYYTQFDDVREIYRPRTPFAHKGDFGRALLVAGSRGMMGAAVLAGHAALCTGAGLLKYYTPACGLTILQTALPEAMVLTDASEMEFTEVPELSAYQSIGLGPGWLESDGALDFLTALIRKAKVPLVIDAGALNVLSRNPTLLAELPAGSILTPHKKEFDRLSGVEGTQEQQEQQALAWAQQHRLVFVLKGKYSAVVLPDGTLHYNSTGNAGMAKGGSGDCLTGVLTALLAQGYPSEQAALMGVFLHGYAGDCAAEQHSQEAMLPTDLIRHIGDFFQEVKNKPKIFLTNN